MSIFRSSQPMEKMLEGPSVVVGYAREIDVPAQMVRLSVYDGDKEAHICMTKEKARNLAKCIIDYADGKGW